MTSRTTGSSPDSVRESQAGAYLVDEANVPHFVYLNSHIFVIHGTHWSSISGHISEAIERLGGKKVQTVLTSQGFIIDLWDDPFHRGNHLW